MTSCSIMALLRYLTPPPSPTSMICEYLPHRSLPSSLLPALASFTHPLLTLLPLNCKSPAPLTGAMATV